jgi:hypothetical protein
VPTIPFLAKSFFLSGEMAQKAWFMPFVDFKSFKEGLVNSDLPAAHGCAAIFDNCKLMKM